MNVESSSEFQLKKRFQFRVKEHINFRLFKLIVLQEKRSFRFYFEFKINLNHIFINTITKHFTNTFK